MAKKRESKEPEKGNWLDTYADMVTLLLCFFVLLYSASSVDETKWQYIYQAFTSSGTYVNPFVMDELPENNATESNGNAEAPPNPESSGNNSDEIEGLPQNFNQLYSYLSTSVEESDLGQYITIEQTPTRIFIRFDNTILFDGNSAVLKEEGKQAMNKIMPGIRATQEYIKSCSVSGHTAFAISEVNDWDLSAARASSVVKYADYNKMVESHKFTVEGKACYSPVADNDTEEGRAQNRRVEMMIVRNDLDMTSQAVIDDILKYEYRLEGTPSDPYDENNKNDDEVDKDVVDDILDGLESKYEDEDTNGGETNGQTGPVFQKPTTGIPTDILTSAPESTGE
ncbi:MAG: flagellar motor protein MotB [Ruminiclostridium sp.]|nr:flagellar motor protein MotB [Ruminiclostridium sp.]